MHMRAAPEVAAQNGRVPLGEGEGLRLSDIQSHPQPANFTSANLQASARLGEPWLARSPSPPSKPSPAEIMPQASGRGCGQPHEGDGGVLGTGEREKDRKVHVRGMLDVEKEPEGGKQRVGWERRLQEEFGPRRRWRSPPCCDWLHTHFLMPLSRRLWVEETGRGRAHAVTPCVGPLQRLRGPWDRASFGKIWGPAGRSIRRPAAI